MTIIPPKQKLDRVDGSDGSQIARTLWIIPWWPNCVEDLGVDLPTVFSVHLNGFSAERFQTQCPPKDYKHGKRNASFVSNIRFLKEDATKAAATLENGVRQFYNLKGVAIVQTLAPTLFTQLHFEDASNLGGMILTTRAEDKLRTIALNILSILKDKKYLPGFESPAPVLRLQDRLRPTPFPVSTPQQ